MLINRRWDNRTTTYKTALHAVIHNHFGQMLFQNSDIAESITQLTGQSGTP